MEDHRDAVVTYPRSHSKRTSFELGLPNPKACMHSPSIVAHFSLKMRNTQSIKATSALFDSSMLNEAGYRS